MPKGALHLIQRSRVGLDVGTKYFESEETLNPFYLHDSKEIQERALFEIVDVWQ